MSRLTEGLQKSGSVATFGIWGILSMVISYASLLFPVIAMPLGTWGTFFTSLGLIILASIIPLFREIASVILSVIGLVFIIGGKQDWFAYLYYIYFAICVICAIRLVVVLVADFYSTTSKAESENKTVSIKSDSSLLRARYCKLCGGLIDNSTKKCTSCGRQYFHIKITKSSALITVLSFICMGLACLNVIQYYSHANSDPHATSENSEMMVLKNRAATLESIIASKMEVIKENESQISEMENTLSKTRSGIEFLEEYVVIVSDDGTNFYHKYDCDDLDLDSFWVFNPEAAEENGYIPCPKCFK